LQAPAGAGSPAEQSPRLAELSDLGLHVVTHDLDTRHESAEIMGAIGGAMASAHYKEIGRRVRTRRRLSSSSRRIVAVPSCMTSSLKRGLGVVQTDGAKMYPSVFKHRPNIMHIECMAHLRRYVLDAIKSDEQGLQRMETGPGCQYPTRLVNLLLG
jgi:hypothetical protein